MGGLYTIQLLLEAPGLKGTKHTLEHNSHPAAAHWMKILCFGSLYCDHLLYCVKYITTEAFFQIFQIPLKLTNSKNLASV